MKNAREKKTENPLKIDERARDKIENKIYP